MSTIRDVAHLAQVSTATVSRVLNEDTTYKITEETKERVWKAVAGLGYQLPAKRRRKIKNHKPDSGCVGCIISTTLKQFVDPFFITILSGIEERMLEKGYRLSWVTTSSELQKMYRNNDAFYEGLDGLILMDSLDERVHRFIREQVDYVVGIDTMHKEFDNVGYDHFAVSEMAVTYLHSRGYREIGFIGGSNTLRPVFRRSRRLVGYLSTMDMLSLPVREEWMLDTKWSDELCMQMVSELYRQNNLPRAFYAASDLMAIAALKALQDCGVKVPQEVAVIGVSDINEARYSNPPLTTVKLAIRELGIYAADLLIQRMQGDVSLPRRVLLPYSIVERSST